jgi:hypothetical protein
MKTITEYQCEICEGRFPTGVQAAACERVGFTPLHQVGEIVFAKGGFGWYDGQENWISNPGVSREGECPNGNSNCFEDCCCFRFYYVITFIDKDERDGHRPRYHVATMAMTGKQGYRGGYTYDTGHEYIKVIKNPPATVLEESKSLIGTKMSHLL